MPSQTIRDRALLLALAFVVALASTSVIRPLVALAAQPAYIETPVNSTAPDASQVRESYVSLYAPLPAADGPHPAACDRIGYLRFRAAGGPTNPALADAIYVAQPGFYEGAGAFDQVARNTVRAAAANGYHVEFWALDRRSQCLVDDFGVQAAAAVKDPQLAVDYYYEVPSPGPSPEGDPGHPYTSAASQVSDITQFSRSLFETPAQFIEEYYPTALVTDLLAEAVGDRQGSLAALRYANGYTAKPTAYIDAGEGITPYVGALGTILPSAAPEVHVVAPGYNHLDVVTAAYQQNNGRPELTSSTLASWMSQIVGPPAQ